MTDSNLFDVHDLKHDLLSFNFRNIRDKAIEGALKEMVEVHIQVLDSGWRGNGPRCRLAEMHLQDAIRASGRKAASIPDMSAFQEVVDRIGLLNVHQDQRMDYYRAMHPQYA